jgi:hypothetical protein
VASRNLGTLTVDLLLKMGGFKQGMDAAARETAQFEKRMTASFRSVGNSFKSLGAALGIGLSLDSLRRAASAAIQYGDEINKAAIKTGIGAEAFSELAYAAKQNDVELSSLGTALKKMQVSLSEAKSGSKAANESLAALGLTIEGLRSLAPEKQFEVLADRIAALKDPADRTRAAVDLFGKAGADLLPLFEEGAAGIRALREEAQRMGATLTGEQAAALAATDDAIKRLSGSFSGLTRNLTANVAPALTVVFDAMSNALSLQPRVLSLAQAWEAVGNAFKKNGLSTGVVDVLREAQAVGQPEQRSSSGLPPGGRDRRPFVPGYQPEPPKPPKPVAPKVDREAADALQAQARAYQDIYENGVSAIEGLRSPLEEQLASYHETRYALERLAETYPNLADEASAALQRLQAEGLEPITITAEKIFPPKEQEQLSVFFEEASRGVQGILADFIFDPFKDGLKGLAQSFGDMLLRMAAEAAAAKIAESLFGTGGTGSGGGWVGTAVTAIGDFFKGKAEGGYTGDGGKYEPAGIVHRGEYVVNAARVRKPGMLSLLASNQLESVAETLRGFSSGGLVGASIPMAVPAPTTAKMTALSPMSTSMNVTQQFAISSPTGTVSMATQQQIAAAAARGLAAASRRNN